MRWSDLLAPAQPTTQDRLGSPCPCAMHFYEKRLSTQFSQLCWLTCHIPRSPKHIFHVEFHLSCAEKTDKCCKKNEGTLQLKQTALSALQRVAWKLRDRKYLPWVHKQARLADLGPLSIQSWTLWTTAVQQVPTYLTCKRHIGRALLCLCLAKQ